MQPDSLCAHLLVTLIEWKGLLNSSILSSQASNSRMALCIRADWPPGTSEKLGAGHTGHQTVHKRPTNYLCQDIKTHQHARGGVWDRKTGCRFLQWHNSRVQQALASFAQLSAFPQTRDMEVTRWRRSVGKPPFRCSLWRKKCESSVTRHSPAGVNSDLNVVSP